MFDWLTNSERDLDYKMGVEGEAIAQYLMPF